MSSKRGGKKEIGGEEAQPITLPPKAIEQVRTGIQQVNAAQGALQTYLNGLSVGLKVPDGWMLHPDGTCFVPPPPKDKEPK